MTGSVAERRERFVHGLWATRNPLALALLPAAALFCLAASARRAAYRRGWLSAQRLPVPVIVVGNISVGGTGKTPLVARVVTLLRQAGYRPGIVSRGYGGTASRWPQCVTADSEPYLVGDEPVLLAARCLCPVAVGPRRAEAARELVTAHACDVVVSDDGLQHYPLARDVEIAVSDGVHRYGNGYCLPAGPLRERLGRLQHVDLRVCNGGRARPGELRMVLVPGPLRRVDGGTGTLPLQALSSSTVHAVAGIGRPQRFFELLREAGVQVIAHPYPDHHRYVPEDIAFGDDLPVLMTEKDAVKCRRFADARHRYLPVEAELDAAFGTMLLQALERKTHGQKAAGHTRLPDLQGSAGL
jgi:tetraacyldisaccharide 4'-kinase